MKLAANAACGIKLAENSHAVGVHAAAFFTGLRSWGVSHHKRGDSHCRPRARLEVDDAVNGEHQFRVPLGCDELGILALEVGF